MSFASSDIVFVTGANGHTAQRVVDHLLASPNGPKVRAAVCSDASGSAILEHYPEEVSNGRLQVVQVANIQESSSFDTVMQGVTHVALIASPFVLQVENIERGLLKPAIEGSRGVLTAALKQPTIKSIVATGAFATIADAKGGYRTRYTNTNEDFNQITYEEAKGPNLDMTQFPELHRHFARYMASKRCAEAAIWRLYEKEKPSWTPNTNNTAWVGGPYVLPLPSIVRASTSTGFLHGLATGADIPPQELPTWIDVRDVVKAYMNALQKPNLNKTRILLGGHRIGYDQIADTAAKIPGATPSQTRNSFDMDKLFYIDNSSAALVDIKDLVAIEQQIDKVSLSYLLHFASVPSHCMMATTMTTTSATYALDGDEAPHWRVEHAITDKETCTQAQCKNKGINIEKGELRIGTHQFHTAEEKYYWAWRHWRCATRHQLRGLKALSDGELAKVPGYERISDESREQLKLALEEGKVIDKDFKDIRPDLIVKEGVSMGEIRDAVRYNVEASPSTRARCRAAACKQQRSNIAKGELRLAILRPLDGEHTAYIYKHWKYISEHDLSEMKRHAQNGTLTGIDVLPKDYKAVVLGSLEKGEAVAPPKLDVPIPTKNSHAKKVIVDANADTEFGEEPPNKNLRKGKYKKGHRGKNAITWEVVAVDVSRGFKTEDPDQGSSNKEALIEAKSSTAKRSNNTTKAEQVVIQEKLRNRNNAEDGCPNNEDHGEEISVQGQTAKKRKIADMEDTLPADGQAVEKRAKQFKRGKKSQAAVLNETIADKKAEIAPKDRKHEVSAAGKATKKERKAKAMKTVAQKGPDRGDAATGATTATEAGSTIDEDASMAYIAELWEFIQAIAVTTRIQRY
ncbi:hypothetical protein PMIN02_004529 [Paraphaeosphaeria minitans]|uniref:Nad dependent epimerase n=1 Tax=Paraphaeosphaeria minitans TaxID=565426 RepID=A0A9P6G708_9PLEO|nr:nad dependent epimerase [Paraphaeosphaeria minitans]